MRACAANPSRIEVFSTDDRQNHNTGIYEGIQAHPDMGPGKLRQIMDSLLCIKLYRSETGIHVNVWESFLTLVSNTYPRKVLDTLRC